MQKEEIRDLFISVLVLTVVFSISNLTAENMISYFLIIGMAFVFHEIAHINIATRIGAKSVYRIWPTGLLISLVLGIVSGGRIIFAAPGAVFISSIKHARWKTEYPSLKNEEYGLISSAGPVINLTISIIFILLNYLQPSEFFVKAASINILLGFFNLLPIPPLDGYKIIRWCRRSWLVLFLAAFVGWIGLWFI